MNTNKLESYVHESLQYFAQESKKRGDKKSLDEFKKITDAYLIIQENLGQLGHEIALNELKNEFKNVIKDICEGMRHAWKRFFHFRQLGRQEAAKVRQRKKDDELFLDDIEKQISELPHNALGVPNLKSLNESHRQLMEIDISVTEGYRLVSWSGAWVDAQLFGVYLWYIGARLAAFLQFHFFVFVVLILMAGITYSKASTAAISFVSAMSPSTLWLGSTLLLCFYTFKKYFLDKKLKKLQKIVETKLYRPLSVRILITRTLALQVKMLRDKPKSPAVFSS